MIVKYSSHVAGSLKLAQEASQALFARAQKLAEVLLSSYAVKHGLAQQQPQQQQQAAVIVESTSSSSSPSTLSEGVDSTAVAKPLSETRPPAAELETSKVDAVLDTAALTSMQLSAAPVAVSACPDSSSAGAVSVASDASSGSFQSPHQPLTDDADTSSLTEGRQPPPQPDLDADSKTTVKLPADSTPAVPPLSDMDSKDEVSASDAKVALLPGSLAVSLQLSKQELQGKVASADAAADEDNSDLIKVGHPDTQEGSTAADDAAVLVPLSTLQQPLQTYESVVPRLDSHALTADEAKAGVSAVTNGSDSADAADDHSAASLPLCDDPSGADGEPFQSTCLKSVQVSYSCSAML